MSAMARFVVLCRPDEGEAAVAAAATLSEPRRGSGGAAIELGGVVTWRS